MALEDNITVQMQVTGALSMCACMLLFVSCYNFTELRSKGYIKLLLNVCISSFFFSTAVVIGSKEKEGSPGCWYQGIVANYFGVCQVLWIIVISYEVYSVVLRSRVLRTDMSRYHYICWIFPLFTTFLPLTTNTYGRVAGQVHMCGIVSRENSPYWGATFWTIASFYIWIWLAIGFISFGLFRILVVLRGKSGGAIPASIRGSIIMLGVYPLILVFCWIVPTFSRVWFFFPHNGPKYAGYYTVTILCNVLPNLMGFLVVCALFSTSEEIRRCWYDFLFLAAQDRDSFSGSRVGGASRSGSMLSTTSSALMDAAHRNPDMVSVTNPMSSMAGEDYRDTFADDDGEERLSRFSQLGRFLAPTFGFGRGSNVSRSSTTSSAGGRSTSAIGMTSISSGDINGHKLTGNSEGENPSKAPIAGTPAGSTLVPSRDNPVPVLEGERGGSVASSGSGSGSGSSRGPNNL